MEIEDEGEAETSSTIAHFGAEIWKTLTLEVNI